jgi:crotonobetainyl-CoA:carnitine CoA-transferase CaiB-like acyl-CoA transferase
MLGADVIKIESRHRSDGMRRRPATGVEAAADSLDSSLRFSAMNLNKRSVSLDLSKPKGRALAKQLTERADVVIENFRPGVAKRLGLGYEDLSANHPELVMASISARGQSGPDTKLPGYASIFAAVGGASHLTGFPGQRPADLRIPLDYATGTLAAMAVIAALLERQDTGKGQYIDLAASDVATCIVGEAMLDYSLTGRVQTRRGNRHPFMAPHDCYPCQGHDKWISIAVSGEDEWQALCRAMDSPAWTRDPNFKDARARWLHHEELDRHLSEWTRQRTAKEAMDLLQSHGVAAVPSFSILELSRDPHVLERQVFVDVDHAVVGKHTVEGAPWKLSRTPPRIHSPGPLLGEHTRPVLREWLGLSGEEIDALTAESVLE